MRNRQSRHTSVLFSGLDNNELEQLTSAGQQMAVSQGDYVYRQGEKTERFFIILSGEVELTRNVANGDRLLAGRIGPGGHFGETSLLTDRENSLNVLALSDLTLLVYEKTTFNTLLLANQTIRQQMNIALAHRLRLSFVDHAGALAQQKTGRQQSEHWLDPSFFSIGYPADFRQPAHSTDRQSRSPRLSDSTIYRQIERAVKIFSGHLEPLLITGENGTGRRMVAHQVHAASAYANGPYVEIDIRDREPSTLEDELFGSSYDPLAFSGIGQPGILEQVQSGTLVLHNADYMEPDIQRQLSRILKRKFFTRSGGEKALPLRTRIILICKDRYELKDGHQRLLPALYTLVAGNHFQVAPLREHRRDIPRLIHFYLRRYNRQYGKNITRVDDQALGRLINYEWPGNLTELAGIIQRSVVLARGSEPLSDQIFLGLPRSEGKWEYNLLRLDPVRRFVSSRFFPALPRAAVGLFFLLVVIMLAFGSTEPEHNIGLTLSWVVGWPLMIFAFFFLARTWCSVCGLSVPGWVAQRILKPKRATPKFIRQNSGWLMAALCVLLFWIEIAWNAYASSRLTAAIILSITLASLFFSAFFQRRVWCRYLCPLGAVNALFSMPSILELRANTQMCLNRCSDHACYTGDESATGCPMFRHPFLVDNNRDCILCGQCVKNCGKNSIHLNVRLAPQELWNQQNPRNSDSVLVICLAAIFFPFAIRLNFPLFLERSATALAHLGLPHSVPLAASLLFFACVIVYLAGYAVLSRIIAAVTENSWKRVTAVLGYGMIPLVLGAYMAVHLDIFVKGIWLLPANVIELVGMGSPSGPGPLLSSDATFLLQAITVIGGLLASLYATRRIVLRLLPEKLPLKLIHFLPSILLCISAIAYLLFM